MGYYLVLSPYIVSIEGMMSMLLEFSLWLVLAVLIVYGWSSLETKEIAYKRGKRYCSDLGVQFLDESVALARVSFSRSQGGQIALLRVYDFEFTVTGERRFKGEIMLQGRRVVSVETESYSSEDENSGLG